MKLFLFAAALLLPLAACKSAGDEGMPSKSAASPTTSMVTGAVGEDQFKAMHELKQGTPPVLYGEMITVGGSRAYLSLPPGAKAPMPAVVVIHEWWGLNDNVKHWADRLASDGYAAIAVDLYGGVVATTSDAAMTAMKAVDPEQAKRTMLAAYDFLAKDPRVQAKRRGSIGWCFGGGESLALALAAPDLDACVMYYGRPETDPVKLAPLNAPLLGIFGTRDASIPPTKVAEFDQALNTASKIHTLRSYDADHAFANPSNPHYDEKNAAEAWRRVRAFLAEHLKNERGAS